MAEVACFSLKTLVFRSLTSAFQQVSAFYERFKTPPLVAPTCQTHHTNLKRRVRASFIGKNFGNNHAGRLTKFFCHCRHAPFNFKLNESEIIIHNADYRCDRRINNPMGEYKENNHAKNRRKYLKIAQPISGRMYLENPLFQNLEVSALEGA